MPSRQLAGASQAMCTVPPAGKLWRIILHKFFAAAWGAPERAKTDGRLCAGSSWTQHHTDGMTISSFLPSDSQHEASTSALAGVGTTSVRTSSTADGHLCYEADANRADDWSVTRFSPLRQMPRLSQNCGVLDKSQADLDPADIPNPSCVLWGGVLVRVTQVQPWHATTTDAGHQKDPNGQPTETQCRAACGTGEATL
jgi:hypothetical protein